METIARKVTVLSLFFGLAGFWGCQFSPEPRSRLGSYPGSTLGTKFLGKDLGEHSYKFSLSEKNGVAYTCFGGHIDTAHSRKAADWTKFLFEAAFGHLMKGESDFSFRMKESNTKYLVKITYPENWESLAKEDKEKIARQVSLALAQHFVYTATTWHEIITWFGYKCSGIYSEFPSAFTWEDIFSNLLGVRIGYLALRDEEHSFDQAVTLIFQQELEKLGVQPAEAAREAAKKVRGKWFTGDLLFFIDMPKRNFDIGLNDGLVTPWLIPFLGQCPEAKPQCYPVPDLKPLSQYGFSMILKIELGGSEKKKISKILYPEQKIKKLEIEPEADFPKIMDYIKKEAIERYGPEVDLPE